MNWVKAGFVVAVASVFMAGAAEAAKCSSTGGAFETWKKSFAVEAKVKGVKPKAISALMGTKEFRLKDGAAPSRTKFQGTSTRH